MLDLPENLSLREFRVRARYLATRLRAQEEMRALAADFDEAHDKLAMLEEEEIRLALRRAEVTAEVEAADDAWDEVVLQFVRRLLELSGGSQDHPLYRKYFADLPSQVTCLSHLAEIMISKELEAALRDEPLAELAVFAERLEAKRRPLENILVERTRLEVEEARFANRVALAKTVSNQLRRAAHVAVEEIDAARGRPRGSAARYFDGAPVVVDAPQRERVEVRVARPPVDAPNGDVSSRVDLPLG